MIIITLNKKIINLPTSLTINWPRLNKLLNYNYVTIIKRLLYLLKL